MLWFKKKSRVETIHDNRVEVVVHQQAREEIVKDAKEANDRLLTALQPNHITLKLYVAAGGKIQKGSHR